MNEQQGIDLAALLIRTAAEYGGDLNGALYDLHLGRKAREAGMAGAVIAAAKQAEPVARDVLMAAMNDVRRAQLKIVREGLQGGRWIEDIDDAVSGIDLDAIADRYAAQPPTVAVLQAELDEWRKLLDPHTLHLNLCRGFPAKLTAEQLLHIAGDEKQRQAAAVPDGYALVPIDPTAEMLKAADRIEWDDSYVVGNYCNIWNYMLAAAQKGGEA